MHPGGPPHARRLALAFTLLVATAGVVVAHGPAIGPDIHDDLVLVEREWRVTTPEPEVFDLDGRAYEPGAPDVAFRVHADAMLVEGALTVPEPDRDAPPPVYNTGVRLVAIVLEPPLRLSGETVLSRILLGPLVWENVTQAEAFEGPVLTTSVDVPWPGPDGVSPAEDPNETRLTGVRLAARFTVVDVADADDLDDPDVLHGRAIHSPAELRIGLAVALGPSHDGGSPSFRLATWFDFVHPTDATRVAVDGWEGIRLERDGRFASLFAHGTGHAYRSRSGADLGAGPARLSSPIAMNITGDAADGDASTWRLGLGFAMPREAWTPATSPATETPAGRAIAAPGLVVTALVGVAFLALGRRPDGPAGPRTPA